MYIEEIFYSDRIKYIPITFDINIEDIHEVLSSEDIEEISKNMILVEKSENFEDTKEFIEQERKKVRKNVKMSYVMRHRETQEFIGISTISYNNTLKEGTIGIWLRKEYWGKELSMERAIKFSEILFDEMGSRKMISMCFPGNEKAKKSIKKYIDKLDGKYIGIEEDLLEVDGELKDVHVFIVNNPNYKINN